MSEIRGLRWLRRLDAHIAWAATIDEPTNTTALALREALSCWFGAPLNDSADHRSALLINRPNIARST